MNALEHLTPTFSIVIPVFNEAAGIAEFHSRLAAVARTDRARARPKSGAIRRAHLAARAPGLPRTRNRSAGHACLGVAATAVRGQGLARGWPRDRIPGAGCGVNASQQQCDERCESGGTALEGYELHPLALARG